MFVIFGKPETVAATETYAWAVAKATGAKSILSPTGRVYRTPRTTDVSLINRLARQIENAWNLERSR